MKSDCEFALMLSIFVIVLALAAGTIGWMMGDKHGKQAVCAIKEN